MADTSTATTSSAAAPNLSYSFCRKLLAANQHSVKFEEIIFYSRVLCTMIWHTHNNCGPWSLSKRERGRDKAIENRATTTTGSTCRIFCIFSLLSSFSPPGRPADCLTRKLAVWRLPPVSLPVCVCLAFWQYLGGSLICLPAVTALAHHYYSRSANNNIIIVTVLFITLSYTYLISR